ncbi:hypothetical protein GCM10023212_43050 [Luteolibacter yonseiensis]
MCIYIQGVCLGDIRENHCSLFHATDRIRAVAADFQILWDESLASLSDTAIFTLIDKELYEGAAPGHRTGHTTRDFLTNTGEMFDGAKTFVVFRPPDRLHILFRLQDDTFGSASCNIQTFRNVADAYVGWFEEQVRTTAPPYFPINPFDLDEKVPDED